MEKGIQIHENVFYAKGIKKPEKHIGKLNKGKFIKKSYLVGFCNDSERLEIFLSYNFLQKIIREQKYTLVGLFNSQDEAFEYVRALSDISFNKYGCFDALKTVNELNSDDIDTIKKSFEEDEE